MPPGVKWSPFLLQSTLLHPLFRKPHSWLVDVFALLILSGANETKSNMRHSCPPVSIAVRLSVVSCHLPGYSPRLFGSEALYFWCRTEYILACDLWQIRPETPVIQRDVAFPHSYRYIRHSALNQILGNFQKFFQDVSKYFRRLCISLSTLQHEAPISCSTWSTPTKVCKTQ